MSRTQSPIRSSEDRGIHGSVLILLITLLVFSAGIFWVSGARRTVPPAGAQAGTVTPSIAVSTPSVISPKAQAAVDSGTARVVLPDGDGTLLLPELAEVTRELNAPDSTIQRDFEILDIVLDAYRKLNGGANPAGGENDEIVAQLSGEHGRRPAVLSPHHPFVNPRGQLLDRWGTPFHFHPVSRDTLDVRSAGPDGKLWTPDDVVLNEEGAEKRDG